MIDTNAIRRRVLGLAMHGQLTTHFSDDGTAEELYLQIQEDRKRLEALGKFKKKSASQIDTNGKFPYEIPTSWKWVHLSDIALSIVAGGDKPSDFQKNKDEFHTIPVVANGVDNDGVIGYTNEESKGGITITVAGRGTIGFTVYRDYKYYPVVRLIVIEPTTLIDPHYLTYVLQNSEFNSTGSSIPQLTVPLIAPTPVPLPPYKEQRRIVEVVDSVLFILDSIDDLQANYNDNRDALKAKIIDAGIQGKLTQQFLEDGDAVSALKDLEKRRAELVEGKAIRKRKVLPEVNEADYPFAIPKNWKWVHISDVWAVINGDRGKNYPAKSSLSHTGIPFISALNLDGSTVVSDDKLMCLSDEQYERLGSGKLKKGDVVVCIRGSLGKHGKYPFEKGAIASSLIISRNYLQNEVINDYLMIYLDSQLFKNEIEKYNGGSAQPNLAAENFEKFRVPFPPLAEQERIVERVNELLENISER